MKTFRVRVPATTSNLGPGFDSLGLALTLHNDFTFAFEGVSRACARRNAPEVTVKIQGFGADDLPTHEANLVWRAAARALRERKIAVRRVVIRCVNRVPLCSGLGSSATACVGGLVAGNALRGGKLSREDLLSIASEIEGHADNAAAALWGGLTACYDADGAPAVVSAPLKARFQIVACTPETGLSTKKSRAVLPRRIPHGDAVVAVGRVAALTAMLATGDLSGLAHAMDDTLHQAYRAKLVPGMEEAFEEALSCGALGCALSGAGPTLVAVTPRGEPTTADKVARALERVFGRHGLAARSRVLRVDRKGARVLPYAP